MWLKEKACLKTLASNFETRQPPAELPEFGESSCLRNDFSVPASASVSLLSERKFARHAHEVVKWHVEIIKADERDVVIRYVRVDLCLIEQRLRLGCVAERRAFQHRLAVQLDLVNKVSQHNSHRKYVSPTRKRPCVFISSAIYAM